jgi:hypothetical protein
MRITVIFPDNSVYVDGSHRYVALPPHDANWRAIQWYDTWGDVEVKMGSPFVVEDFAVVAPFVSAWEEAAPRTPVPQPGQPSTGVEEM